MAGENCHHGYLGQHTTCGYLMNVRTVTVRGVKYIRMEDAAELVLEVASTEETDVRNRLTELAYNLRGKNEILDT